MKIERTKEVESAQAGILQEYESGDLEGLATNIERLRVATGLTIKDFCALNDFSRSTFKRLTNPKNFKTDKKGSAKPKKLWIDQLLDVGSQQSEQPINWKIDEGTIRIQSIQDIYERHSNCSEMWAFKNRIAFKAGINSFARRLMADVLMKRPELIMNFVFYGPSDPGVIFDCEKVRGVSALDHPAFYSFCTFKSWLYRNEVTRDSASRLKGWLVRSPEVAFKIGLSCNPVGIVIDLDTPLGQLRKEEFWKDEHDVFLEMPSSTSKEALGEAPAQMVWHILQGKEKDYEIEKLIKFRELFCSIGENEEIRSPNREVIPFLTHQDELDQDVFMPLDFNQIF